MVVVDDEVAGRLDGEVEQAVGGERGEQVIEEPDPRTHPGLPAAVEVDGDGDGGLASGAVDGSGSVHGWLSWRSRRMVAARRWAVRPSAVASWVMVGAMAASPCRSRRCTWRQEPKSAVERGP